MAPRMGEGGLMPRMGTMVSSARVFYTQPGVQRALPTIAAAVLVIAGLIFYIVLQTPDRTTLFASLPETEKAKVLETFAEQWHRCAGGCGNRRDYRSGW